MYDSIVTQGSDELLQTRLTQAMNNLRGLTITTKEDALSAIYAAVNGVLALGNNMTPLAPVTAFTPARVGDLTSNFGILNQDAAAIIQQLLDTENDASGLYNSYAAAQNTLRQAIRQKLYASSTRTWQEDFVQDGQLVSGYTANLDFNAGVASNSFSGETFVTPSSIALGVNADGSAASDAVLTHVLDGNTATSFQWNGKILDLVITFNTATIINTAKVELLGYQGLVLDQFTSTPDGILMDDLLAELGSDAISLDGNSNKFAGDWYGMFAPRYAKQLRIVLRDVIGTNSIQLRNLTFSVRKYGASGTITSKPIYAPTGTVVFEAASQAVPNLTTVTHQYSADGTSFSVIEPGQVLTVASPFWYRAELNRLDANFAQASAPLNNPTYFLNYSIKNFSTTDLGGGVVSRKAVFSTVSGAVNLGEVPLSGSLALYLGNTLLAPSNYTLSGSVLTFVSPQTNVTLQYQTSAYGAAGIQARQPYYTPYLQSVKFQKVGG